MQMNLPEEKQMWQEKQEIEHPKEETDDNFIPAKEVKLDPKNALVYFEL